MTDFDKYETSGAYHWKECDRGSFDYNPPLVARYQKVLEHVICGKCLEVGCGDGFLSSRLATLCEFVVGIEFEGTGIQLANRLVAAPHASFLQASGYSLPLRENSFDCVVLADVIEHLDEPGECLREVRRVLKPSGLLLVTTPQWRPDRVWDTRHVVEYRPRELQELLSQHFETVRFEYFWPRFWSDLYRTKIGWRLLKLLGRIGFNPFLKTSGQPEGYCQMLALCTP